MPSIRRPWLVAFTGVAALGLALSWNTAQAEDPPKPADTPKEGEKPADKPAADKPAEKPAADKPPEKPISEPVMPGEPARDFAVKDLDGKERKLSEFKGKWVVLEWTNYDCGFVKKHYKVTPEADGKPAVPGRMAALQKTYTEKGVIWLSICSSAPGKPAEGDKPEVKPKEGWKTPDEWRKAMKERMAAPTAVLLDEDGTNGRRWGARRTPTVWIVDPKGNVGYYGAPDDKAQPTANPYEANSYIAEFLDAVLAGKEPPTKDTKPYG